MGLPALPVVLRGPSAMINLIGEIPSQEQIEMLQKDIPHLDIHLYGKQPRPGRKLGHINLVENSMAHLTNALEKIESILGLETPKQAVESHSYS